MRDGPAEAVRREPAPAKLNLDLLVTGRRADGYHELDSLVAFAELGDELSFELAPDGIRLEVDGPFAAELPAASGNLVHRAARHLAETMGVTEGARITLTKRLPVASGIGGGSADAAAALRGLRQLWRLGIDDAALRELGLILGADIPVCLHGASARMRGIGERLDPVRGLPALDLVLVNPRLPLSTAEVFRALRLEAGRGRSEGLPVRPSMPAFVAWLQRTRNDLQAPACTLLPAIGEVLETLAGDQGCWLARMSGSGPTCFGIFADAAAAAAAAGRIAQARPGWWAAATRAAVPA